VEIKRQVIEKPQTEPGEMIICTWSQEIFRLKPNGDVLYKGHHVTSDKELVDGLREVFEGNCHVRRLLELEKAVRDLMLDWSELDTAEDDADIVVNAPLMKKVKELLEP
jgi:hypothetical protein